METGLQASIRSILYLLESRRLLLHQQNMPNPLSAPASDLQMRMSITYKPRSQRLFLPAEVAEEEDQPVLEQDNLQHNAQEEGKTNLFLAQLYVLQFRRTGFGTASQRQLMANTPLNCFISASELSEPDAGNHHERDIDM